MPHRNIVTVLLLWCCLPASAAVVSDLYTARVPVADQSEAALERAAVQALTQVLIKVTGETDVASNPAIATALPGARDNVQRYSYTREPEAARALRARIEFAPDFVTALVVEAGMPLWTANRPPVLVWLAVADDTGRELVNQALAPQVTRRLAEAFSRRGVPIQWPLLDLADTAALDTAAVWRLDAAALAAASARYRARHVLAGRVLLTGDERVMGAWYYQAGEVWRDRFVDDRSIDEFFAAGADLAARAMAERYAVSTGERPTVGLAMTVAGVGSYTDYAAIVGWLEGLEPVERASVTRIRSDTLELRLDSLADAARLANLIALDRRFQRVPTEAAELSYRWRQ